MPKNKNLKKLKLFYIADFLMTETDEDHGVFIRDIEEHLEIMGVPAEQHSISRDLALLRDEFGMDIQGGRGKPFYLKTRKFPVEDISVIAECVGSAKFISQKDAERLLETLKLFCNRYQAERIASDYFVAERPRQTQKTMLKSLKDIRKAIEADRQISFYYTKRNIKNLNETVYRSKGEKYRVSPFSVVLSEGNHYLVGYDEKYHQIKAYRIDRMEGIATLPLPREGEEQFKKKGISDYARQTFGMFVGPAPKRITLLCDNRLLDTMIERFGNSRSTEYKSVDEDHFTLTTSIVVSPVFYGWIAGLGGKAIIQAPEEVVESFKKFLEEIRGKYQ